MPWHLLHSKPAEAQSKIGQNEGRGSALTPRVPMDLKHARGRSALQWLCQVWTPDIWQGAYCY